MTCIPTPTVYNEWDQFGITRVTDTARAAANTPHPEIAYSTVALGPDEPEANISPEIGSDEVYIGCGADECHTLGWDVSYLSADGHLWDPERISAAERDDDKAGYTVCNHCGRVYANSNRDGGPMPTVARIDISTPAWANALTRYEQRTFALQH